MLSFALVDDTPFVFAFFVALNRRCFAIEFAPSGNAFPPVYVFLSTFVRLLTHPSTPTPYHLSSAVVIVIVAVGLRIYFSHLLSHIFLKTTYTSSSCPFTLVSFRFYLPGYLISKCSPITCFACLCLTQHHPIPILTPLLSSLVSSDSLIYCSLAFDLRAYT